MSIKTDMQKLFQTSSYVIMPPAIAEPSEEKLYPATTNSKPRRSRTQQVAEGRHRGDRIQDYPTKVAEGRSRGDKIEDFMRHQYYNETLLRKVNMNIVRRDDIQHKMQWNMLDRVR
ncbi:unnamed protein product [Heligmosomoides polygyrus]|uniref:Uncharacterized protein n=1 Tax=Heligmosomoides polygyrus TaxID=6339 RepID=A0A183F1W2_HELPZ|nr:unnamed protein product [Heligmosomoides polygyrus]